MQAGEMSGWVDILFVAGVAFCMVPLKAWQRWKSPTSALDGRRWSVIGDSWSQLDCGKWIPSSAGTEMRKKEERFNFNYLWWSHNHWLMTALKTWVFVSFARPLTLEKEPLQSHCIQKPVAKQKRKKRPLNILKEKAFNSHHHSHHNSQPSL